MNENPEQKKRTRRIKWISFIAIDIALAVALLFLFSAREEVNFHQDLDDLGAIVYPQQLPIADNFALHDQADQSFSAQQLQGKWSLVFFGFTNCPNICPLTMAELGQFYRTLKQRNDIELPQIVMVTVDPERDDSAAMAGYIAKYDEEFLGLTGDASQIEAFAKQLYVVIDNTEDQADANMESHDQGHGDHQQNPSSFDHSGHISVINPDGELHAVIRLPHRDQNLVDAYHIILDNWN